MIGQLVGNFQVIGHLGKGGMGEVWLGEHKTVKTRVAIKMLLPHISADKRQVERFFNEAVAVGKIKHSGITKIFDVGFQESGAAYLIMELLEGETLASRIARTGRLSIGQIADIGRQIASVLEATHAAGITHRDLKPENVFLVPDIELSGGERAKLLDFGIAKLGTLSGITGTSGGSMGTPAYMAPEQWKNSAKVDWRADVYALGCLTFEMACGRPPFIATSIGEACDMHMNETPPSSRSIEPELPVALDRLLARMLAKEPAKRADSIREVANAFVAIGDGQPKLTDATLAPASSVDEPREVEVVKPRPRSAPRIREVSTAVADADLALAAPFSTPRFQPQRNRRPLAFVIGMAVLVAVVVYFARGHPAPVESQSVSHIADAPGVSDAAVKAVVADHVAIGSKTPSMRGSQGTSSPPATPAHVDEVGPKPEEPAKPEERAKPAGEAPIDGAISDKVMASLNDRIDGCYQGASGDLRLAVTVSPGGYVKRVAAIGTFANTPTGTCAEAVAETATFPAWQGQSKVFEYKHVMKPCDARRCALVGQRGPCCVKLGGLDLPKKLDDTAISRGLKPVEPLVMACIDKDAYKAKGMVTITARVLADGSVGDVSVEGAPAANLADCIATVVRRATFAHTQGGDTFHYTINVQ